jgi:lipopolysaccharide transport system ATP-binding protein
MTDVAIRAEGLSKRYQLALVRSRARYKTLQSDLLSLPARLLSRLRGQAGPQQTFWALRDVSFDVRPGEVLGIIGSNGAGKSTLLKILSRITQPTTGQAEVYGRVGSLLEVGTGFHPELTGRENITLSGAVLGMSRRDVRRKFDEIVAFAGVEQFVDTAAKHYSSGMYLRLAFAVAAHLEPEILLVDEVLAVGDAEFQKKCLGKMGEVASDGRTILFVSHNMAAVQHLCGTAILLAQGQVVARGPAGEIIARYMAGAAEQARQALADRPDRQGSGVIRFTAMQLLDERRATLNALRCGEQAILRLWFDNRSRQALTHLQLAVGIDNHLGERIAYLSSDMIQADLASVPAAARTLEVHLPRLPLAPGRYAYTLFCTVGGAIADWVQNAGEFEVEPGDFFGSGKLPPTGQGFLLLDHHIAVGAEGL